MATHICDRSAMKPPPCFAAFVALGHPRRLDVFEHMGEWSFKHGGIGFAHVRAEIDDPGIGRPAGQFLPVRPRPQHFGIGPTVRVRKWEPLAGQRARNVERAHFHRPLIRASEVFRQGLRLRQIRVDPGHRRAVETRTAAPAFTHGSSRQASKILVVAAMRSSTARLAPLRIACVATRSAPPGTRPAQRLPAGEPIRNVA